MRLPVTYKIEKGVPITKCSRDAEMTKALQAMKLMDSIVVKINSRATAFVAARRMGMKITTRKQEDGNIRVWRTK